MSGEQGICLAFQAWQGIMANQGPFKAGPIHHTSGVHGTF